MGKENFLIIKLKLLINKHMNINQRGFANIILVIGIVVILVGVVGYFAFVKKSEPVGQQSPTPDKNINWETYT
ncbi:MAG: hypothetical protein AABY14_02460, partial [Nanoarchaeota archaeon]